MVYWLIRARGPHRVDRDNIAAENGNGGLDRNRLRFSDAIERQNRNIQNITLGRSTRNRGSDFTSVFINLEVPRTAVVDESALILTVVKAVTVGRCVLLTAAQALFGEYWREIHCPARPFRDPVIFRDLNFVNNLEADFHLICGLIRIGCLHRRGDNRSQLNLVIVRHRGDLAGRINRDSPALWHGGGIHLKLRRGNRLVALHDGLGANLGRDLLAKHALCKGRAHQIGDLRVIGFHEHEKLDLVGGTV